MTDPKQTKDDDGIPFSDVVSHADDDEDWQRLFTKADVRAIVLAELFRLGIIKRGRGD